MFKVSVLIPLYNYEWCIERAVGSVVDSRCDFDIEVIIVDDCSTDDSYLKADSLFSIYPNVYVYQNYKNSGLAFTRNECARRSSGEYLCFLDPDDEYLPHKLQEQVDFLDSNAGVHMVYGKTIVYNEFGKIIAPTGAAIESVNLQFVNPIPCQSIMIRNWVYMQEGGCNTRLRSCEDWDLWIRLHDRYNIQFMDKEMYILHQHSGQYTRKVVSEEEVTKRTQWHNNANVKRILFWGTQYDWDYVALAQAINKYGINAQVYICDFTNKPYLNENGIYYCSTDSCENVRPHLVIHSGDVVPEFNCKYCNIGPDIFNLGQDLVGGYEIPDSMLLEYKSFIKDAINPCELRELS